MPSNDDNLDSSRLEVRHMVDEAYNKLVRAMFESLSVIAKESPAIMATQSQGDPEDKEALNYHILYIENMNHFYEDVNAKEGSVLADWRLKSFEEMQEHMNLYVDAVVRRPLGKLMVRTWSNSLFMLRSELMIFLPIRNSLSRLSRCWKRWLQT